MRRLESLALVLVPLLVFSSVVNVVALGRLVQLEDYRREYEFVCDAYQRPQETYSPKPPISQSEATDIALEHFEYKISKGPRDAGYRVSPLGVTANLSCVIFRNRPSDPEFVFLHGIIGDVGDYSPREICRDGDRITVRYVWAVTVSEVEAGPGPLETTTRHVEYLVDASTGQVIHFEVEFEPRIIGDG